MAQRGNEELWIISAILLLTGFVRSYSPCYDLAKNNSHPVALLCYDNQISGRHVVIDAYRARESSTKDCQCRVSSDKPSTLNFTNYNGVHPELGCGSNVMVQAGGTSFQMNCFVTGNKLPINGSDVNVNLENPQLASDTSYCISVESADSSAILNVSCEGDTLPSTTTTIFPPTTEQEETSSSSLTTGSHITTDTSMSSPSTTIQVTTTTALQSQSTSTQSSATTEVTSSLSTTDSQISSTSTEAATTEALMPTTATLIDNATSSSSSQTVTTSVDISTTISHSVTSGQTTEIDTTTEDVTTDNDVTTDRPESTTGNDVIQSSTAPSQTQALTTSKDVTDSTTIHYQTSKPVTTQIMTSTTTGQVSTQPMTSMSYTTTVVTSTGGIQSTTLKRTTPFVTTSKPLQERGTPWSGIIPAILLGIILLVVFVFAFIKCQRSREIKYPKDSENNSTDKYPSMGETNFGYDAYDEGPDINTEFTKIPEEIEIDGIVLSNTTIDDVESHVQPHNITEGPFVRYNVKDYRASRNIPKYAVVNKGTQNGPDIYF